MARGNNKPRFSNPIKNLKALLSIPVSNFIAKDANMRVQRIRKNRKTKKRAESKFFGPSSR